MKRTAVTVKWAVVALMLATAGSACSSGSSSSSVSSPAHPGPSGSPAASGSAAKATGVATVKAGELGTVLVDDKKRTLYLFVADKSTKSTCTGSCAAVWPPLLTHGAPVARSGVKAELLGVTKRADGSSQVTYGKHPLYLYAPDTAAGQSKGQSVVSFGAAWYVVDPAGEKVTKS